MKPARAPRAPRPQAGRHAAPAAPWWTALWSAVAWGTIGALELDAYSGRGRARSTIPTAMKTAVLVRDGRQCVRCAKRHELELHHRHEAARGGKHSVANLVTLCSDCHFEWTSYAGFGRPFENWLTVPPLSFLAFHFLQMEWPAETDARTYQQQVAAGWLKAVALLKAAPL